MGGKRRQANPIRVAGTRECGDGQQKSKLAIICRPIGELIPYARNSRSHTDSQIAQIAASIKEFGFTNPVLIDGESGIIAGHGRVLAAERLKMAEVPTIELRHFSEAQRRGYVIADNKLALNAGWNEELLAIELGDLKGAGFDLGLIGFSPAELKSLLPAGLGPGGDAPSKTTEESWAVIVECEDEADQVALIERLQGEGRTVRGSVG